MKHIRTLLFAAQILAIALLSVQPMASYAVPASPNAATITQPDGSKLTVRVHGDEFFNYTTTSDGYTIALGADRYFYYADYNTGSLKVSATRVGQSTTKTNLTKGVMSSIITMNRTRAIARFSANVSQSITRASVSRVAGEFLPKIPVLLAQYSDIKFVLPNVKDAISNMLNLAGYSVNGATGSIADYYEFNSMGTYRPEFIVSEYVTLSKTRKYYGNSSGGGDARYQEHAKEICELASTEGKVDFSLYDANTDGIVDLALIYFAGGNAAQGVTEAVWPHKYELPANVVLNGKTVKEYICSSELQGTSGAKISGIGTMTHEFAHALGLQDIYDATAGDNQNSSPPYLWGQFCLMNRGPYNNSEMTPPHLMAFERAQLGWITLTNITSTEDITLEPIQTNKAYKLETGNNGEFFTFENRQGTDWDKYITTSPIQAMIIMHIDKSGNSVNGYTASSRWSNNTVNGSFEHQCARFVTATASAMLGQSLASIVFPGTNNVTSISHTTVPSLAPWSGKNLGVDISNIAKTGSNITFTATVESFDPAKVQLYGTVRDIRYNPIANATINIYNASNPPSSGVGPLFMTPSAVKTRSTPYTVTAAANGSYTLANVVPGEYIIEVTQADYTLYSDTKTWTSPVQVNYDITLVPTSTSAKLSELRWDNQGSTINFISTNQTTPKYFWAAAEFSPSDLAYYDNNTIESVTIASKNTTEAAEVSIMSGTTVLGTQTVYTASGQKLVFNFSDLKISKKNTKPLRVVVKTKNMGIDPSSPAITGKGNLYSLNNIDWGTMPVTSADGNWVISVKLNGSASATPVITNLVATANQREALVTWKTSPNDIIKKWQVRWKKSTDANYSAQNVDKQSFLIKNLTADATYSIQVAPVDLYGEQLAYETASITTTDVTAPYPAIFLTKLQYEVGDDLMLLIQNKPAGVSWVTYKVNGTAVTGDSFPITAPGEYIIVADITYTSNGIETITRKIKVN